MPGPRYVYQQEATHGLPTGCGWRFHIAIRPTHTQEAMEALRAHHLRWPELRWEYLHFEGGYDDSSPEKNAGYDPMYSDTDQDLRGKEICVYFPDATPEAGARYSPDAYKHIMLPCWKALQDANVPLWYITPSGAKPILTDTGHPTPFSYASIRLWAGERHGLLHETDYNPDKFDDPLARLSITESDLERYGIAYDGIKSTSELMVDLEGHSRKSQTDLDGLLHQISRAEGATVADLLSECVGRKPKIESVLESINSGLADIKRRLREAHDALRDKYSGGDEEVDLSQNDGYNRERLELVYSNSNPKEQKEYIERSAQAFFSAFPFLSGLIDKYPRASNGDRDLNESVATLQYVSELEFLSVDNFSQCIDRLSDELPHDIAGIKDDYGQLRGQGGIFDRDEREIADLIERNPNAMQIAYRRQVHIMHEKGQLVMHEKGQLDAVRKQLKDDLSLRIDREIGRLEGWSPFKASSKGKIYLLGCLRDDINEAVRGAVNDVIYAWQSKGHSSIKNGEEVNVEASVIIANHRNLFFSEERWISIGGLRAQMGTSTQLFIGILQMEFGNASLGIVDEAEPAAAAGGDKLELGN